MGNEFITGVILAGGASSRFGRDKALFEYRGMTLLERAIRALEDIFSHIMIVADVEGKYPLTGKPCHGDLLPGIGPFGGLYTALIRAETEKIFLCACDMPLLSPGLIGHIASVSEGFDVAIPSVDGRFEPLHAVYAKGCLGPVKERIDSGERRLISFFDKVRVRVIDGDEIRRFIDPSQAFRNINYRHEAD